MKKQFIITISMQTPENLRKLSYKDDISGKVFHIKSCYPSIPLIDANIDDGDEVTITAIMVKDDNGRSQVNLELFEQELKELSNSKKRELKINSIVTVEHNESRDKQVEFFKDICSSYDKDAKIYMDITYGTKATPVVLFSSLIYAEKVCGCDIKKIVYGKYSFNESEVGEIFDIRCLYDMNMVINAANHLPKEKVGELMSLLWR